MVRTDSVAVTHGVPERVRFDGVSVVRPPGWNRVEPPPGWDDAVGGLECSDAGAEASVAVLSIPVPGTSRFELSTFLRTRFVDHVPRADVLDVAAPRLDGRTGVWLLVDFPHPARGGTALELWCVPAAERVVACACWTGSLAYPTRHEAFAEIGGSLSELGPGEKAGTR